MTAAIATRAMKTRRRKVTYVTWGALGGQGRSQKDSSAVRTAGVQGG